MKEYFQISNLLLIVRSYQTLINSNRICFLLIQ